MIDISSIDDVRNGILLSPNLHRRLGLRKMAFLEVHDKMPQRRSLLNFFGFIDPKFCAFLMIFQVRESRYTKICPTASPCNNSSQIHASGLFLTMMLTSLAQTTHFRPLSSLISSTALLHMSVEEVTRKMCMKNFGRTLQKSTNQFSRADPLNVPPPISPAANRVIPAMTKSVFLSTCHQTQDSGAREGDKTFLTQ